MKIQPKTFIASAAVALLASSATGNFFQGTAIGNFLQGGESGTPSPLIEFEATKPAIAGEVNANFEVLEADIWELDFDANLNRRIRIVEKWNDGHLASEADVWVLDAQNNRTVEKWDDGHLALQADLDNEISDRENGDDGERNYADATFVRLDETGNLLADYATEAWVQGWVNLQGFLTAADLVGYATQTWVNLQGFLTAADLVGYATEAWVDNKLIDNATQTWVVSQDYATNKHVDDQDALLQDQINDNVDDIDDLNAIDRHGVQLWNTAGTYTWTVPAGVKKVYVTILGAGGGAGSKDTSSYTQLFSGGDGASYWKYEILVEDGYQVDIVVGAGGTSSLGAPSTGDDGGVSTLTYSDSTPSHTITIVADGGLGATVNNFGGGSHGANASPLQGPLMRENGNGSHGSPAGADGMALLEW